MTPIRQSVCVSNFGRVQAGFGERWTKIVLFGRLETKFGPSLPNLREIGRIWPKSCRTQAHFGANAGLNRAKIRDQADDEFAQEFATNFQNSPGCQCCGALADPNRPKLGKFRPANLDRNRPMLGRRLPNLWQVRPNSANFGVESSKSRPSSTDFGPMLARFGRGSGGSSPGEVSVGGRSRSRVWPARRPEGGYPELRSHLQVAPNSFKTSRNT